MKLIRRCAGLLLIAIGLSAGACGQALGWNATSGGRDDATWKVQFAFTNFRGEHAKLEVGGEVLLDDDLNTPDWSSASSRHLTSDVTSTTQIKAAINGVVVYEGSILGPHIKTIYIDPGHSPIVRQTDHVAPLLD